MRGRLTEFGIDTAGGGAHGHVIASYGHVEDLAALVQVLDGALNLWYISSVHVLNITVPNATTERHYLSRPQLSSICRSCCASIKS